MENSKIAWTDHTFSPWLGCAKVSPACDNCYAEALMDHRFGRVKWGGERQLTSDANWRLPFKWNAKAKREATRDRVFCSSLSDVFDNQVPDEWRSRLWYVIGECTHLDWLLLTKRPQNISKMLPTGTVEAMSGVGRGWPWPHVWLGTTVENQVWANRRLPEFIKIPAARHFVSAEPLLESVDFSQWLWNFVPCDYCACPDPTASRVGYEECCREPELQAPLLDLIICGGESGKNARPFNLDWAREIKLQCSAAGVAFFMKQIGSRPVLYGSFMPVRDAAGADPDEWPEDLRIREMPT